MLIAANFHYIRDSFAAPFPSIFGVTPAEFRAQLNSLGEAGDFVGAADIVAALDGGKPLPERAIAITFDDGLAEQCTMAWPILRDMGIPAIFYVNTACIDEARVETVHKVHLLRANVSPQRILVELDEFARQRGIDMGSIDATNATVQYKYDSPENARLKYLLNFALSAPQRAEFVDRALARSLSFDEAATSRALYMSPDQLRELDAHGAIGTHGHSHVVLGRVSAEQAEYEMRRSVHLLGEWGCRQVKSMSYPYGSLEACSVEAANSGAALGLRFAFTMERAANQDLAQPMFLARFANNDLPGVDSALWPAASLFQSAPPARWHRQEAG
jgi:peptidoglycan/xylan/chitin deacetylase (PgdA/CDA1 family)